MFVVIHFEEAEKNRRWHKLITLEWHFVWVSLAKEHDDESWKNSQLIAFLIVSIIVRFAKCHKMHWISLITQMPSRNFFPHCFHSAQIDKVLFGKSKRIDVNNWNDVVEKVEMHIVQLHSTNLLKIYGEYWTKPPKKMMMCYYCNVMNKTVTLTLTIGSDRNRFTPIQTSYMSTECINRLHQFRFVSLSLSLHISYSNFDELRTHFVRSIWSMFDFSLLCVNLHFSIFSSFFLYICNALLTLDLFIYVKFLRAISK